MTTKERPILFSAPMVRAILDGSKTQTRRVVKAKHLPFIENMLGGFLDGKWNQRPLPYGKPGDRLWVRETWSIELLGAFGTPKGYDRTYELRFKAGGDDFEIRVAPGEPDPYIKLYDSQRGDWRPSIHMPRWASRILLEIVSVRVERLQDISEADADAEGCERLDSERVVADWKLCQTCGNTRLHRALGPNGGVIEDVDCQDCDTYAKRFKHLWQSINGAESWDANPWVWVIEFKRVTP